MQNLAKTTAKQQRVVWEITTTVVNDGVVPPIHSKAANVLPWYRFASLDSPCTQYASTPALVVASKWNTNFSLTLRAAKRVVTFYLLHFISRFSDRPFFTDNVQMTLRSLI